VHTAGKKTSVRVFGATKLFLKKILQLDLQPVQLISPTSITDKKIHQPSKDIIRAGAAAAAAFCVIIIYCALN
jgi:hypothetical protein